MTSLVYFCGWDYLWVVWKSTLIIIIFTPTCFFIASVVLPLKAKLSPDSHPVAWWQLKVGSSL